MKQGIGFSVTVNIIAVFIVVTFAFLVTSLNYYKAYKVNNVISEAIEKYEGYNKWSSSEIDKKLTSLGYVSGKVRCGTSGNKIPETKISNLHSYCLYKEKISDKKFRYKIVTYINFNIPVINQVIDLPVTSKTEVITYFSD